MGSVFMALVPLLTLLFAVAHHQERFHLRSIVGALLAFSGVAFVFREQISAAVPIAALIAMIMGAACIAESSVVIKGFPKNHPVSTNAVAMGVGSVLLMVLSVFTRENRTLPQRPATWAALAYLILFGSCVAFILILYVLKHWTAATTSYQMVLLPFISIPASTVLTGEKLSPLLLIGAALVLSGVYVGAFTKKKSRPLARPAETIEMVYGEIPVTGQTPIEHTDQP
jgi:drug/metabolite transporter (DMT)-like permease